MAAVVEPIVTEEKLLGLLGEQCEQSVLDYKAPLDLSSRAEIVEFTKDIAAMRSNPDGGYIVIGANDRGVVVPGLTFDLARHFDEATLRPKVEKYLTAPEIHTACHQVDGHNVVLVYVAPAPNGWSVIHTAGQYTDAKGRERTIFRPGDVLVRHGTSSERWNDADAERLLAQAIARRKDEWRKELTKDLEAQAETARTVENLTHVPAASVSWNMDADTFEQLVTEFLRRHDDVPVRRLLSQASCDATDLLDNDQEELRRLLDGVTTVAALAIEYDRGPWLERAVTALVRIYELGFDVNGYPRQDKAVVWLWLDIVTRVYALGGLAVRTKAWATVKLLADRRPEGEPFGYWGSWLRHAVTMAFRARIFETEEKAGLLARAHNIIRSIPSLHPDRPAEYPAILTSLCQFDVYSALVVIGERGEIRSGNFYTNFARYYSPRSTPAFETIVSNRHVRDELFDGDDRLLADAIREIISRADNEGFSYDGWSGIDSPTVTSFIQAHASPRV